MERARWRIFRAVFFLLSSLDIFLLRSRAQLYDEGFRISHAEWLFGNLPDCMIPGGSGIDAIYYACSMLALLAASGMAYSASSSLIFLLYSYGYFSNRIDGFQHHYMLCVIFSLLCLTDPKRPERGMSSIRTLIGIVYFYTAVTKMDQTFFSGDVLIRQLMTPFFHDSVYAISRSLRVSEMLLWNAMSAGVICMELVLSTLWLSDHRGWIALLIGIPFHISIQFAGFQILRFSFYMFSLYILMAPEWLISKMGALSRKEIDLT